ncbi:uncharacterized protein B0T15DRAFT_3859 [Chaetomium strumarium]|uniref:Zn(2)-C6 fungal-type domain-containing protein n=1 Tax=Chaetomium strumarium TaxID=1170767 RepID=A0AAJ0M560_9PEZI|nr:hypothetical protein B0T15DRAFT_3859 [Chaetomium strumarium]
MGRQPTSGYCQTCRRRRVKCDKTRPECKRCAASGHTCGGYVLPLRVHAFGVQSETDGTQRLVSIQRPSSLAKLASRPPLELDFRVFEEEISASHFFNTFNWAPFWRPAMLAATNDEFPAINKLCFRAISYGYMGLGRRDQALQAKGRQLYGQVLTEFQSLLRQPPKAELAKLGFTIVLMGIYEFVMNNIMGRAPPHHVGIIRILQHCGPETYQDERLLDLFRSCRALLLCQSLCRQSRCFLEETPWKTIPWQRAPKTFEDRLMDIFVDLPGIAEAVVVPTNRAACLEKIDALSIALNDWRWNWQCANSGSVRQVHNEGMEEGDITSTPLMELILQASLEFDSPRLALDILLYNAALVYLMQIRSVANGQDPRHEPLSPDDEGYIRQQIALSRHNPLLLPGTVKFRCQAAAEGFMTLSCIRRLMATTPTAVTVVTPATIGIVYCALRDQLQLDFDFSRLVSQFPIFQDPQRVFAGYFVSVDGSPGRQNYCDAGNGTEEEGETISWKQTNRLSRRLTLQ